MILQEANTIPGVTVAQNIFAGREKEFASGGVIHMKKMIHRQIIQVHSTTRFSPAFALLS